MSVLQNSKEEALNNAFKGDDNTGENNIVQELTKEIIAEVQRMTGNDVCCDCGAPGEPRPSPPRPSVDSHPDSWKPVTDFPIHCRHRAVCSEPVQELVAHGALCIAAGGGWEDAGA